MQTAEAVLAVIHERGRRGLPLRRLYRQLFNRDLYLVAYGNLYANQGAMTRGTTRETVDGMSLAKIDRIIAALRGERYRWTPVRRVHIPKANGKTRPLGIPPWSDKLLQEVMRLLLEAYFEPQFSDHSHGFRPGRGCHTALQEVVRTGKGTKWFIEGDIRGCYDNIDHQVLLSILGQSVHDARFLRLVAQLLRAGYCEHWRYHPSLSGTPQGGVISPLLSNIYLDRLDKYVEGTLIPASTRGQNRRKNPAWNQAMCKAKYWRKKGHPERARPWAKLMRQLPSQDHRDPDFRRLRYVRYADDFLLCFTGPKAEAQAIKDRLATFLREHLKLELSAEKTLVTHAATGAARFLGYEVVGQHCDTKQDRRGCRSLNGNLALRLPKSVLKSNCDRYLSRGKVAHRPELMADTDYDIVQQYQWHYAGVVNYYLLAQNVGWLAQLHWVMQRSLLRTLANKHRASVRAVWRRYRDTVLTEHGPRRCVQARIDRPGKEPLVARFGGLPLRRKTDTVLKDRVTLYSPRRTELSKRLLADQCELCGRKDAGAEVHHVRKLANLNKPGRKVLPDWKKVMIARRRKTLVVCHACHQAIHAGSPVGRGPSD